MSAQRRVITLRLDGARYGVDVEQVQEVLREAEITPVPLAPRSVAGLLNLRGRIVTALDLRRCLGLPERPPGHHTVNLVVTVADNPVSLLADEVGEVVELSVSEIQPRPETAHGPQAAALSAVATDDHGLLLLLDVARVMTAGGV